MPLPRKPRPAVPLLVSLAAAAPLLAGCSVPVVGLTGVTVSKDGQPMGVVLVCDDRIDSAVFHPEEPAEPEDPEAETAAEPEYTDRWSAAAPVEDFATWPLASPTGGAGWTPEKPPRPLRPGQVYTLYGATRDNSSSTDPHSFTLADLTKLTPDQVRYTDPDTGTARTATVADFRAHACEERSAD
ncbi:hypothetical protein [Streptomyces sp. NPDC094032]|uniref:hypothetical protein n=1 Tax=Streptomyces sp. NPDC094032 TaxID=3155308 RepID=UPI00332D6A02